MKNKFQLSILLFAAISFFSCSTNAEKTEESGESINNPVFADFSSVSSRTVKFYEQDHPEELYFTMYSPLIVSFDDDNSLNAGDKFERNILGIPVFFETSVSDEIVIYAGKSEDNNILVDIEYNTDTKKMKYKQVIAFTGLMDDGTKEADFLIDSEFEDVIDNKGTIHSRLNFYLVKVNVAPASNGAELFAGYIWGKSEFYLGKNNDNKNVTGFCTHTMNSKPLEETHYDILTPSMMNDIKTKIAGFNQTEQPGYCYGVITDGTIDMELYGASIVYYNDISKVLDKCPWTLFED